ncbi:F-box domain-containing protein [Lentithecium fluviatile CBS 122367]|uniref:F-box domain-containing protein n=1 Tax=Lentithecium fluviatile CBS 122367 TaxID=1168545 RepID=A0A6G1J557_9PLEO|nr:F-box domain-containing protein [Lentithecium fluviatile CBS 122367]
MAPSFTALPTEILDAVFLHLDPPSLVAVSQTCKLVKKITVDAPIIWRHFCQTHYKSWAPHHDIAAKFAGPLSEVDWHTLFMRRVSAERETRQLLNRVLETQQGRLLHINEIADFGYDVKDTLLKEIACPDDAEDVLARRFFAGAVLQRIQREMAIHVWRDLQNGEDIPIETGLGAYDMFTRTGEDVDLATFSRQLDDIAKGVLRQHPDFQNLSARQKASTLASYLRDQGFRGVSDAAYRALRNSFFGIVLSSSNHESLPLTSVAIYCALAKRLGLDARPCGFLFHVYTIVYAPKDYTLDGQYRPTISHHRDFMYLDPFRSSDEVFQHDLRRVLREMGVPTNEHEAFLADTSTREMVLRTARNIMNSVQTLRQTEANLHGINGNSSWAGTFPDIDSSFYATIWAMLILGPSDNEQPAFSNFSPAHTRRRQYLPYLLDHFQTHYPWDLALVEQYIIPMFYDLPAGEALLGFVQSERSGDRIPKGIKRRTSRTSDVKFKVGQMFRHKRYYYEGAIIGWDTYCAQREEWIQHMGVDRLAHGRDQCFYHVLSSDKSIRYVAQENILPITHDDEPSPALLRIAGRYFKRWDDEKCIFVSNVKDEYPDD